MTDDDILTEAKEAFDLAKDAENENRNEAEDDLKFARLGEQWPDTLKKERGDRPCLTINTFPAFIRQVVNDSRQNKPQIKVRPIDSNADVETAEVISGLIRNIENQSKSDIAYDTAADFAVTSGLGYIRVDVDFSHDDTFEKDIRIERVPNPFNVYGDPYSRAADSSDWNSAFLIEPMSKDEFERRYKDSEPVDWDSYANEDDVWFDGVQVTVAEWWKREEVAREIVLLSNGQVMGADIYDEDADMYAFQGILEKQRRTVKSHKITHRVMTAQEILETTEWPGKYIPIIPVYGDELNIKGKRYFRSLIRDAKDAARMKNYWRSAATELVALAPKAPFIGPEEAFTGTDARKWESANTDNYSFLAYGGDIPPVRQPFAGVPAGALQEALNANDDMKAIMGLHDASLGARSNETSGRAIVARQREGDVSTFHFQDNLNRAVRHTGIVVLDLIPHVYNDQRVIRVMGWDGVPHDAKLGQPGQPGEQEDPNGPTDETGKSKFTGIYDLTVGKYDLTVESGPSYTTQRQETAEQMIQLIRHFPAAAPVIGDLLVKNLDWAGADEIAKRLRGLMPGGGEDPRLMQMAQQMKELEDKLKEAGVDKEIDLRKIMNAAYDSETKRMAALAKAGKDIAETASPAGPYDQYQSQ